MLTRTFNLILAHRSAWNVQRLLLVRLAGPRARAPAPRRSAKALRQRRPDDLRPRAQARLRRLPELRRGDHPAARKASPGGPHDGDLINDVTRSFSLASSEVGSSFACRIDAGELQAVCLPAHDAEARRRHPTRLRHEPSMRPATESAPVSRSFTVDSTASAGSANRRGHPQVPGEQQQPQAERLGAGGVDGEAVQGRRLHGSSAPQDHRRPVRIAGDHGPGRRQHVDQLPGDRAVDAAGNASACSTARVCVRGLDPRRRRRSRAGPDPDDGLHPHLGLRLHEAQSTLLSL